MQKPLIQKIEINYFRSIYAGILNNCTPLNIIVGGNDSGKSNVLRALNLFFNNQTDLNQAYDFDQDLSIKRIQQTQVGKTKAFISVKITFNNIFNYSSLPETFAVKRQWNRYSDNAETYIFPKQIKQNILYRFLNKIELHYVPAVKSKEIFKHYLRLLYDTLVQKDIRLSEASSGITEVINAATAQMTERIKEGIGVTSNIAVPRNFRDLFGDLDFLTQIGETEKLSLKQRGDGIQVGHIPYILDFVSQENSGKHYIWLYEEPENSLEMRKAFELAEKFQKDFSKRNQIFVTTHSPAFYSLDHSSVGKWGVKKSINNSDDNSFSISEINELQKFDEVDENLGITALVAERAREIYEENASINKKLDEFKEITKPIVLCEGKTDVLYIKKALELNGKSELLKSIKINEANSNDEGSGCDLLQKIVKINKNNSYYFHFKVLFVFDCDVAAINPGILNENTEIFKFIKQDNHPFKSGIENALSCEVASLIKENSKLWSNKIDDKGHKEISIKELKKSEACEFVCSRNNPNDFLPFKSLIKTIETFSKK